MAGQKNLERWEPGEAWKAVWPEGVSGSDVNGVGETEERPPTPIFWHTDLEGKTFGQVQGYLLSQFGRAPQIGMVYASQDRGPSEFSDPEPAKQPGSAAEWTERVKAFALNQPGARPSDYPGEGSEADLIGITQLDPLWVFEGYEVKHPNIIMVGVAMDHGRLSQLPGDGKEQFEGQLEVGEQYNRGARVVNHLTQWILEQGYQAQSFPGPSLAALNMIPAAIAAGFGELGDHGSIINRKFGSSFRLAAVATDMPLNFDAPDRFGADEFCSRCQICHNECPPGAISKEKKMVRGVEKYYVDFDKCLPYFCETFGCGICLAVCPWSYPGRAEKLAKKWGVRLGKKE